ncbi:hypothetical protein B0H11DRAFT_1922273 [Mycena galericulata]|nr:hypothetical protein B0H11DRAFT_1922273 [Mycena galericulata]
MDVALAAALEESEVEEAFWGAVREAAERLGAPRTAIVPPLYGVTADPNERSGAPLALPVFPLTAGHVLGVAALEGDLFKQGGGGDTMPAEIADVGVEDAGNEVNIPLALARVRLGLAAGDERGDSGAVQRALRTGRRGVREGGCRWVHPDVLRVGGAKRRGKRKNGGEDAETAVDARKGRCKKVKEGAPGRWMRAQRVGQSPEKGGEAREVTAKHWKEDRQRERITSRVDSKENEIEAEDGTNERRPPWSRGASSSMPGWARIPTLSYPPFPVSPPSPPFRTPPPPHSPIQLPSFSFSFSPTLLLLSRDGTAQRGRTRAATSSWGAVDVPRGVVVDVGSGRTRVGCRVLLVPVRAMDGSGRAGRLYTSALLASERGRWAWGPRAFDRARENRVKMRPDRVIKKLTPSRLSWLRMDAGSTVIIVEYPLTTFQAENLKSHVSARFDRAEREDGQNAPRSGHQKKITLRRLPRLKTDAGSTLMIFESSRRPGAVDLVIKCRNLDKLKIRASALSVADGSSRRVTKSLEHMLYAASESLEDLMELEGKMVKMRQDQDKLKIRASALSVADESRRRLAKSLGYMLYAASESLEPPWSDGAGREGAKVRVVKKTHIGQLSRLRTDAGSTLIITESPSTALQRGLLR